MIKGKQLEVNGFGRKTVVEIHKMALKDKIASCYGHITALSTSRMVGCSKAYVYMVWKANGFEIPEKNPQRTYKGFYKR